jgi:hypothetical protein
MTICIRFQHFEAIEIRVERRWIVISRVSIAAETVRLPNLDLGSAHWVSVNIQHSTHHVQNLPRRSLSSAWQVS